MLFNSWHHLWHESFRTNPIMGNYDRKQMVETKFKNQFHPTVRNYV